VQRAYNDARLPLRLLGMRQLLCNNCGHEFRAFDVTGRAQRTASTEKELAGNRRRAPRYRARLPARISLVEHNSRTGQVWRTPEVNGRCVTISRYGLAVAFASPRLRDEDFAEPGRLMQVTVILPAGAAEMLVAMVTHERVDEGAGRTGWLIGASITKMSDDDRARLDDYLEARARDEANFSLEPKE
jgi:hypothetical protein